MKPSKQHLVKVITALSVYLAAAVAHADAVTDWNAIMQATVATSNPFFQGRSAAIVEVAVFEAVNTITGDYKPYLETLTAPPGASPDAAAIVAAHHTLVALYPANASQLNSFEAASLAAIPDGQSKTDGMAIGAAAASALLLTRANDGWDAVVDYTPGTNPGDWQPTPPAHSPALLPGWGKVTTFGIVDGAQFRSVPPPSLTSPR